MMFSRTVSSLNTPSALRSSGQKATPRWSERLGEADVTGSPADRELSGIGLDRAENQLGDLGAAGPEQSRKSDDFAGAQGEIERRHDATPSQPLGDQDRLFLAVDSPSPRAASVRSSSRPSISGIIFARRKLGDRSAADKAAVAQHRDAVGDFVHLIDEMGDEDDGDAVRLEVAHDLEEERRLVGVEARRRLVEHQHPCVVLERAGDRDELLDGDRIGAERPLDVDVDVEALQALPGALSRRSPVDQPEPFGWRSSVRFSSPTWSGRG